MKGLKQDKTVRQLGCEFLTMKGLKQDKTVRQLGYEFLSTEGTELGSN